MGIRNRKRMECLEENQAENGQTTAKWEETGEREDRGTEDIGIENIGSRRKRGRGDYRLTGSMAARIVAFFLLAASSLVGIGAGLVCMFIGVQSGYTENLDTFMTNVMRSECLNVARLAETYIEEGNIQGAKELFQERNLDMEFIELREGGGNVIWSTWKGESTGIIVDYYLNYWEGENTVRINGTTLEDGGCYMIRIKVDPDFPWEDNLKRMADITVYLYEHRYVPVGLAAGGILLCLICFVFIMCGAGHRNGRRGIVPGALTTIHLDVLTVFFVGGALIFGMCVLKAASIVNVAAMTALLAAGGAVLAVWLTFYCMDFAVRVKMGKCWRYSLIFIMLRWLGRVLRFLGRELIGLISGLPLIVTTLNVYFGICIVELVGVIKYLRHSEGFLLWVLEKVILLVVLMYIALAFRKLLQASRALAEGQGNYQVDTSRMMWVFREHGENLNSLALGISKAVEERTRSERMKTELISNVSHDLKTPLTSIINYADLIWEETGRSENPDMTAKDAFPEQQDGMGSVCSGTSVDNIKVREYAEVLLRQSRRLKKLMDDLVEASKATTGNLEVNLEPCEVGVLLSQAVGEYQQKMEEKELELIVRQPEAAVTILADGRRLWRVFENLLNNICKYAQERSRVYLSMEAKEERVFIIFRNMSKYPLDISGEELEERFVRGDKSRHMEGNGLGLSIAKSMVELQKGQMEIVIDGDLFKAVLSFPLYSVYP